MHKLTKGLSRFAAVPFYAVFCGHARPEAQLNVDTSKRGDFAAWMTYVKKVCSRLYCYCSKLPLRHDEKFLSRVLRGC